MGRRMIWVFADELLMLPPAINPLPASVGEDRIIELPLRVNGLALALKEILLKGVPTEKLLVVAVWVPPVKISSELVVGATPFQFPGLVQLPSGTAPPFQVRFAANAECAVSTQSNEV